MNRNIFIIAIVLLIAVIISIVVLSQVQRIENTERLNMVDGFDKCVFICTKFNWSFFATKKAICLEKCENFYENEEIE